MDSTTYCENFNVLECCQPSLLIQEKVAQWQNVLTQLQTTMKDHESRLQKIFEDLDTQVLTGILGCYSTTHLNAPGNDGIVITEQNYLSISAGDVIRNTRGVYEIIEVLDNDNAKYRGVINLMKNVFVEAKTEEDNIKMFMWYNCGEKKNE